MARKYPEGFYVYLHIRESDGLVFYVGKGMGSRGWQVKERDRSDWWHKVSRKHGLKIRVFSSNLTNEEACEMEKILIYGLRELGHPLVNLTDGGEGRLGWRSPNNKTIYSSLGESFPSMTDAVEYLKGVGYHNCVDSGIYQCLERGQSSAYGRAWSYEDTPDHPEFTGREANIKSCRDTNSRRVFSSMGDDFPSASEAARSLRENGFPKASQGRISSAARGQTATAYRRSWWYDGDPEREYIDHRKSQSERQKIPIVMDDCVIFPSVKDGAEWLVSYGHVKAKHSDISSVLSGRRKSAYGHTWKYLDE